MDERSEAELVAEAARGGREAFAELVRRYERRVHAVVLRLAGDAADADDLAQEAFMTAWRAIGSFRGGSGFYTWLYRIAVNASLTFLKRKGREKRRMAFDDNAVAAGPAAGPAPGDPEDRAGAGELKARVDAAVGGLPAHFRAAFALVVDQGLSHAEAGRVLGCSENTVSWRLHKARKMLRERLGPWLEEGRS
ncbi:MAG: sigma-70 family RNA polymerase sigma factor [Candidatus Aminicenantes bacterium]|nr:sigma-70 family RNA polymerase sigma factor [Candidatus Aminicenantes bacterium]NLH75856.1 sigma-70 family RNA polymerase sigma factor [Acidobacteriota bacterium]